jgi:hypothetical protein
MASVITLSIEPTGGKAFQHGFHLGTDETLARKLAAQEFAERNASGRHTCTVALIRDRRIIGIYDGSWDQ